MEITLLYLDGCPHRELLARRLAAAIGERADVTMTQHLVDSEDEARRRRFHGSPSILIDGVDPFADTDAATGLWCRVYRTDAGLQGAPSVDQLRTVINRAGPTEAPT